MAKTIPTRHCYNCDTRVPATRWTNSSDCCDTCYEARQNPPHLRSNSAPTATDRLASTARAPLVREDRDNASRLLDWGGWIVFIGVVGGLAMVITGVAALTEDPQRQVAGVAGIASGIALVISGFWWRAWHGAAYQHLVEMERVRKLLEKIAEAQARQAMPSSQPSDTPPNT